MRFTKLISVLACVFAFTATQAQADCSVGTTGTDTWGLPHCDFFNGNNLEGAYDIAFGGAGMLAHDASEYDVTSAEFVIDVPPDATVERAFIWWHGWSGNGGGDCWACNANRSINLNDVQVDSNQLPVGLQYTRSDSRRQCLWWAEVTDLNIVQPGTNIMSVTGFDYCSIGSYSSNNQQVGTGMFVFYTSPVLDNNRIALLNHGIQYIFRTSASPQVSPANCHKFDAQTGNRRVRLITMVGGVDDSSARANQMNVLIGSGSTLPVQGDTGFTTTDDLYTGTFAGGLTASQHGTLTYWTSRFGGEFEQQEITLPLPETAEWICWQARSITLQGKLGSSMMPLGSALVVYDADDSQCDCIEDVAFDFDGELAQLADGDPVGDANQPYAAYGINIEGDSLAVLDSQKSAVHDTKWGTPNKYFPIGLGAPEHTDGTTNGPGTLRNVLRPGDDGVGSITITLDPPRQVYGLTLLNAASDENTVTVEYYDTAPVEKCLTELTTEEWVALGSSSSVELSFENLGENHVDYLSFTSNEAVPLNNVHTITLSLNQAALADIHVCKPVAGECGVHAADTFEFNGESADCLCGNGVVDTGEDCDNGDDNGADGNCCSATCQPACFNCTICNNSTQQCEDAQSASCCLTSDICDACQTCESNVCVDVDECCTTPEDCDTCYECVIPEGETEGRCTLDSTCCEPTCGDCQTCESNDCVDVEECCTTPEDCDTCYECVIPEGETEGRCTLDSTCCTVTCGECQSCVGNTCVDDGDCCTTSSQCGNCEACVDNQCAPTGGDCCISDSECDASACERCENNQCASHETKQCCLTNAPCSSCESCIDSQCVRTSEDCCETANECTHHNSCQEPRCTDNVCFYDDIETEQPCCIENDACNDNLNCTLDECIDNQCFNTNQCDDQNPCTDDLCTPRGCEYRYNGICDACFDIANCTQCLALEQCEWLLCPLTTDVDSLLPAEAAGSGLRIVNGTAQFNATVYSPTNISLVLSFNDTIPGHYLCSPRLYTDAENDQSRELESTCPSVPCYIVEDDTDLVIAVTVTASILLPVLLAALGGVFALGAFLWRCRAAQTGPLEVLDTFEDFGVEGLSENPLFVSGEITAENAAYDVAFDDFDAI